MKKYSFLIVDDIIINRVLLKEILKDICEKVIEASNGKEAIGILSVENVDIILMDIEMPQMNGLEATRYIRNELPSPVNNTPIIALTAHNPSDFFEDFSCAGFNDLVTKPYSFEKLLKIINSYDI